MPTNVSAFLSTGVSVGIIAGVVSGLFYLVVAGFRWAGEVRHHSGDWLQRRFLSSSSGGRENSGNGSIMQSEPSQVRDFIERLVESLVAGNLDHVNVNRLYSHPEYKPLDDCDSPSTAHSELKQLVQRVVQEAMTLPSLSKILENGTANGEVRAKEVDLKTYEDILATAILNKVIQRFQQCSLGATGTDGNSNLLFKTREMEQQQTYISRMDLGATSSKCSSVDECEASTASLHNSWSDTSQGEPSSFTLEECVEEEDEEVISCPSSEDAASGRGAELDFYLSGLNFIKRHRVPFPELGMDLVDGEEQREESASPEPTDLMSPVDSWEENWLFQRRKLKTGGSLQSMPVPMLVPNPSEDFRALIGDQDAEDTSDLSDGSEGIYEGLMEVSADRLLEEDVVKYSSVPQLAEATNLDVTNGVDSSSEIGQLDSEYTEDYASVTQLQINSLTRTYMHEETDSSRPVPKPRTSAPADVAAESTTVNAGDEPIVEIADELASPPRPGTIAEREHKKWESAPPLPNNPYSSENIMKRLNKSSLLNIRSISQEQVELPDKVESPKEDQVSTRLPADDNVARYSRDYYVNASKTSTGKSPIRPIEIVPLPNAEKPRSETEPLDERDLQMPSVGNSVTQWQTEINHREELWRKNVGVNRKETDPQRTNNSAKKIKEQTLSANGESGPQPQNKEIIIIQKPTESDLLLKEKMRQAHKQSQTLEKSSFKSPVNGFINSENKMNRTNSAKIESLTQGTDLVPTNKVSKSKLGNMKMNGECVVTQQNGNNKQEKITKMDIVMPSVKDLAKQFTKQSETNECPQIISRGASPIAMSTQKKALHLQASQPAREVHSLTARSISREFREELRRNLPPPRNARSNASHASSSDVEVSTTPEYASDEGSLRNNIAFWEKMGNK